MLKVNNKNCFTVNFEHISHLFLVILLLDLNKKILTGLELVAGGPKFYELPEEFRISLVRYSDWWKNINPLINNQTIVGTSQTIFRSKLLLELMGLVNYQKNFYRI